MLRKWNFRFIAPGFCPESVQFGDEVQEVRAVTDGSGGFKKKAKNIFDSIYYCGSITTVI
jgi:hypothetical protein